MPAAWYALPDDNIPSPVGGISSHCRQVTLLGFPFAKVFHKECDKDANVERGLLSMRIADVDVNTLLGYALGRVARKHHLEFPSSQMRRHGAKMRDADAESRQSAIVDSVKVARHHQPATGLQDKTLRSFGLAAALAHSFELPLRHFT